MNRYFKDKTVYAVDFDGTLCEEKFPEIGPQRLETVKLVQAIQEAGNPWILWTLREGPRLEEALSWLAERGLKPDAVNDNLPELKAMYGNNPRKVAADFYIDDRSLITWEDKMKIYDAAQSAFLDTLQDIVRDVCRS